MVEITSTGDEMLGVLEVIASSGPISTAEIARQRGINRTVAHRLITTLHRRAYVRRRPDGYVVGPMVLRLARAVEPELLAAARPVMSRLAAEIGETVVLHSVDGDEAVVIAQALGMRHVLRVQHEEGSRHSLATGASARALLAFQPPAVTDRVIRAARNGKALRTQLERVRSAGYAVSHDELQRGVHGMAVPIRDPQDVAVASIAIVVPAVRASSLTQHTARLLAAAREIEHGSMGAVGDESAA